MRGTLALVGGAGLGAGLMYLLDPDRGRRRRAELGEAVTDTVDQLGSRDVMTAMREAGARLGRADVVAGARQAMAGARRAASRFDGPRLAGELVSVARSPRSLRPAWRRGRLELRRASLVDEYRWSLLGVAAGVLAAGLWGLWRREPGEVRESITIGAPVDRVFDAWTRFESFPRFMPAVRQVHAKGPDRTHWVISGPGGAPIEFETVVTRREAPTILSWRTADTALVSHGGTARFRTAAGGATRVDVTMWWRPAGGGIGEGVAVLSGVDPAHVLREGLRRFKAEMESQGSPAR